MVAHDSATDFLVTVLVSVKVYVNIGECVNIMAIPVSARSKAWVCGRSLAAIAGSNPAGNMDVWVLGVFCIIRYRSLRWGDRSSRGILSSVVCLSVIVKPR